MKDPSDRSYEALIKISKAVDGLSYLEIIGVFSWILGDLIIRSGMHSDTFMKEVGEMIEHAIGTRRRSDGIFSKAYLN